MNTKMARQEKDRFASYAFLFICLISLFRFFYAWGLNALPDEADYFVWSLRLDFSYFCHPPMLMVFLAFFHKLTGDPILALRLTTVLLSAGSSFYAYLLGREIDCGRSAFISILLLNVTLLANAGALIATPDTPMLFFLSGATYYFYVGLGPRGATRHWIAAAIFTGLALQSKLVAVLVYPSFALVLMLPEHRSRLFSFQPYLALLISLMVFSPVIIWNYFHNWTTFGFQLHHGFSDGRFPNWKRFFEFLGGQLGIIGPLLFALIVGACVRVWRSWRDCMFGEQYLSLLAAPPLIFFLVVSLQKKVEANWPCYAYLPGIILSVLVYGGGTNISGGLKRVWRINWWYQLVVISLVLVHIYMPFLPLKKDRTDEYFGWDQLGKAVLSLAEHNPGLALAANRYQEASELIFYTGLPVLCLNIQSRPNQFDIWQADRDLTGADLLFIYHKAQPSAAVAESFRHMEHLQEIPVYRENRLVNVYHAFRALDYRP